MIVLPAEGNEHSPLKTTPPHFPPPPQQSVPPPYSPPTGAHGQGLLAHSAPIFYQTVHRDIHPHHQPTTSVSQRAFGRFIRAFLVAVVVIVLWGMFIDSVDIAAGVGRSKINLGDDHGYSVASLSSTS